MQITEQNYLAHYGVLRRSGRYPWGSSNNVSTRNRDFLAYVDDLHAKGLSEVEIARGIGISTTQLRASKSIAKNEQKQAQIGQAERLKAKGLSNVAIGQKMGINESSVRALLAPGAKDKADVLQTTANMLRKEVAEKKYVDVGSGVEQHLGVSDTHLKTAVAVLREEGYTLHYLKTRQVATGKDTTQKVLAAPGVTYSEVSKNRDLVRHPGSFSNDGGRSYLGLHPPISIDPKRIDVRYAEDGGSEADGVIFVRRGVPDVSLGSSNYAQVRILVNDSHYLKGMAMYKDGLPSGVDLQFNTNKSNTGNKLDAMKPKSDDPDNPFGSSISSQVGTRSSEGTDIVRQLVTRDSDGSERVTSAMNLVNEEGKWADWSKSLSSQILSKQSPNLARTQLDKTFEDRENEFTRLSQLTNPTVRRKLLSDFGEDADSAAVHLKAAALPRQASHVILPIDSLSPTEIYAPNYRDGERVVLVRHPHGGTFEIPELTVNNNHPEAKKLLGDARDAVGIHHSVANRLSGADFDGDAVLVIPNNSNKIKTTPALEGLKGFDPQHEYPAYDGMPKISPHTKQTQMGDVSNLITDMTIQKASTSELARAVRHSMVVIDSEKHNLNYKQSAIDNGIKQLKEKYQGSPRGGASTLISRAGGKVDVLDRKDRTAAKGGRIDPVTGKRVFELTGKTNFKTGAPKTIKVKRLQNTDDATTLLSGPHNEGTPIERVYAEHSNKLKDLANRARKEAVETPRSKYSASAKKTYAKEVQSLNSKYALAVRNRPLERQAQVLANATIRQKRDANPDMDADKLKKVKFQALEEARVRTGAKNNDIVITHDEWQAIQAGAISDSRLSQILDKSDIEVVKKLATPKREVLMTPIKQSRAKAMLDSGYTRSEVADALGVSLSTLDRMGKPDD